MDRAPLLNAVDGLPGPNVLQDHPAFLRATHSPWRWIPQNVLVLFRGLVLAYLIATGVMIIDYIFSRDTFFPLPAYFFDFAIDSYILVLLYHIITFGWTFTHLYYPHVEDYDGGLESRVLAMMSLPRHMSCLRRQFYFTLFYTVTVVSAFMNSVIYFFITIPHNENDGFDDDDDGLLLIAPPITDILGEGWFQAYIRLALYAIPSAIMIFEMLWLNSIKRPILTVFAGLYLGWAALGIYLTGRYPFFFLDEDEVGSREAVVAYIIGFLALAPILYVLMQGFIALREGLTRSQAEERAIIAAQEALET
ncbi:hypothetical protein BGZ63DRAFT_427140 [Mariannaea sp. PMI_226]|nr:hypothetical protein BGZ63DRAFT_427140 [Mariannaea sp. PMI_226]